MIVLEVVVLLLMRDEDRIYELIVCYERGYECTMRTENVRGDVLWCFDRE